MTQLPPPPGSGKPSDEAGTAVPGFVPFASPAGGLPDPAGVGPPAWGSWTAPPPGPMPLYTAPGPWPSMPPSRKRVHLIWLAVTVASLVLGGVAGFAIGKAAPQIGAAIRSAKAAAGVGPCPNGAVPVSAGPALARRLLPVPAGATHYTKGDFARRVLTAHQLAGEFWPGDLPDRAILTERCFRIAAQVNWYQPSGAATAIWLVQFATANDARSFALMLQAGDLSDPRNSVHAPLRGVADGMLIGRTALDHYGNAPSRLIGDRGNIAIIIHLFTPGRLVRRNTADELLRSQAARI